MIGVLLVSHGKMAEGIKDSVTMIVGEQDKFASLSLNPGQDINQLKTDLFNCSKSLNSGKGVLIFVDLFGASPYNASMRCLPEWEKLGMNVRIITGMNLPMVINAVCNRDSLSLLDLAKECIEAGQENIQEAIGNMANFAQSQNEDDY
ncbi:PTS sugar transporter subunit IIA [Gilliamella sp. B2969]|uniref:PTS sugar transporter subunit IIA n=1 Tax=unclassified Gilliamella TaxID=2685620 RepID=UPI002269BD5C|nr:MULTISPECIES: PTS sugar transporter subunit IIA [unclassified Gilliamella]MCX8713064.1 PTS sugar transporter subunit IIA [Gilliamella sp. B3468]MCX8728456.1 PTS sugar transporter subunit IIA [Gilliamella sp. B2838]MCX8731085.1 PTS sugar transporter subunit IIA [Gilliamella sp. B2969]MCX8752192.1 PTS sugar transporter subunit IIA [Gilliamella sp. B3464]